MRQRKADKVSSENTPAYQIKSQIEKIAESLTVEDDLLRPNVTHQQ
jgi:hypothetical protein